MRWSIGFPAMPPVSLADRPWPPKAPRRVREGRWWFLVSHGFAQQLRQLGDVGGDALGLVADQQPCRLRF